MDILSLRKRLLISALITLVFFLGFAGVALDRSFVSSAKITVRSLLENQTNDLLNTLELDRAGRLILPQRRLNSRLLRLNSGFYAFVLDKQNRIMWRSPSSMGVVLPSFPAYRPGQGFFYQYANHPKSPFLYSYGIKWQTELNATVGLNFVIVSENREYQQKIRSYRKQLIIWLGAAGLLLLIIQALSLSWGLRPVAKVVQELDQIEKLKQRNILGKYPKEIAQLTNRINRFIENERKNLDRYRNTLSDLAHSLKTPLAVMKGLLEGQKSFVNSEITDQITQMNKIIEYQLNKASASNFDSTKKIVNIQKILDKLIASLNKVYSEKEIETEVVLDKDVKLYFDEGDAFELFGAILDNAYKWTRHKIVINVKTEVEQQSRLFIEICDDGPGISDVNINRVFKRGIRLDQQVPGQGIGLAIVREIVALYNGELSIGQSYLGGAKIAIKFPMNNKR